MLVEATRSDCPPAAMPVMLEEIRECKQPPSAHHLGGKCLVKHPPASPYTVLLLAKLPQTSRLHNLPMVKEEHVIWDLSVPVGFNTSYPHW